MKLSIIVPCYNEEDNVEIFYEAISAIVYQMFQNKLLSDWEFLFVDDGSRDDTLSIIKKIEKTDNHIIYISFTRNFGKEAAMLAGLRNSCGDLVAVMDADLQDPPECLIEMIKIFLTSEKRYDCVACRRTNRNGEPWLRSIFSYIFYWLINKFSEIEIVSGVRDFRLMSRRMVDSILILKEKSRFSKGLFAWGGIRHFF